jgi:hypothetical protein
MNFENFSAVILAIKKNQENKSKAYDLGIDLLEYGEATEYIIGILIREIYGEIGLDWFNWFCWESDFGEKDWSIIPLYGLDEDGNYRAIKEDGEVRYGATDENGNPICYSILSTWEFLESKHRVEGEKSEISDDSNPKNAFNAIINKVNNTKNNGKK